MALNTVNTILATIQIRYGIEAEFDADQMTVGEWSLSVDKKIVRICVIPGLCIRMATYEAFEEDMKEVQIILATCQDIQTAVEALANLADQHKNDAAASAAAAEGFSDLSKSYAIGTDGEVRENDDIDNSKYYYEQSKRLTQGFNGIAPMGTIPFAELDSPENQVPKYMFNISDAFTSDSRFKDGGGKYYDVGTNVVRTADDMWDALASSSDQSVVFSQSANRQNIESGEKLSVMFGKIKKWFTDLKPVSFSNRYTDLDDKPSIPTLTNNLLATKPGTALDAVQGKALNEKITKINSDLAKISTVNSVQLGVLSGSSSLNFDTSLYKFVYFIFNGKYVSDTFSMSAIKNEGIPKTYKIQDGYSFTINPRATDNSIIANLSFVGYTSGGVSVHAIK